MVAFRDRGALERFTLTGDLLEKADALIVAANHFNVDAVIDGIEDFFRKEGVPYGSFIEKHRERAKAIHVRETANVRCTMAIINEAFGRVGG